MKTMVCPNCGQFYSDGWKFCPDCEMTLEPSGECVICTGPTRSEEKMCDSCKEKCVEEFSDYLSQLDPAQLDYLDDVLEGNSLKDYWRKEV